jgi:hypothetical protein
VEKEYRHKGTTIDIYVKQRGLFSTKEVAIELKRNFTQKAQLDRLIGQLEILEPKRNNVIVVLCGETSQALVDRLTRQYTSMLNDLEGYRTFAIILKEEGIEVST